jgi:hypothetical protein
MSISGIGSFGIFPQAILSEELIRKLRALGIDPRFVTSESEARMLIREASKRQKVEQTQSFEQKMVQESESELKKNEDTILQMLNMTAYVNKYVHKL